MEDKELIAKLKKLKEIKPAAKWQETNRSILMNQLYSSGKHFGVRETVKQRLSLRWLANLPRTMRGLSQPAVAVFLIAMVIMGGGVMSIKAAKDSIPGETLYIAKILNEKTQQVLTFNETKKAHLGLTFAGNRAKELKEVLEQTEASAERVQQLVINFRKELAIAKERIARMNERTPRVVTPKPLNEIDANLTTDEIVGEISEDSQVFSANLGKEDNGIQVGEAVVTEVQDEETTLENQEEVIETPEPATTTPEESEQADSAGSLQASSSEIIVIKEEGSDAGDAVEEAQALLETQDYDATLSKLEEADDLIEQAGTVKGEEAVAEIETGTDLIAEQGTTTEIN